jgi:hexosaminidase
MARIILAVLLAALAVAPTPALAAKNPRPDTVPALRQWSGGQGEFRLGSRARVVAAKRHRRELAPEARLLAADLRIRAAPNGNPRRGDIVLRIDREIGRATGREGYALRLARTATVTARSTTGVFYGGRTLLQLLRDRRAPRGRALDHPRYTERGLMVDNGRQFFSRAWLAERIGELAGLKLNLLHLHFSDNQGFRLQSDTHPEIVSDPHLTKADVRSLLKVARRHHVTIVPELDAPGHLQAALATHPELQLTNAAGQKQPDKLDVTLPEARTFIADLLGEYLPLFGGGWWHAGADEYLGVASTEQDYELYPQLEAYADEKYGEGANGKDAVLDFVNFVAGIAGQKSMNIRVWSDGIEGGSAVKLDPNAAVEWWENRASPTPTELMERGHLVQNAGWWPLYYVTGGPLESLRATEREMYEEWEANVFEGPWSPRWGGGDPGGARFEVPADAPNQLGAQLNVWNDDPGNMSQEEIAAGIAPRLRIVAQKTWGSPQLTDDYEEFRRRTLSP